MNPSPFSPDVPVNTLVTVDDSQASIRRESFIRGSRAKVGYARGSGAPVAALASVEQAFNRADESAAGLLAGVGEDAALDSTASRVVGSIGSLQEDRCSGRGRSR